LQSLFLVLPDSLHDLKTIRPTPRDSLKRVTSSYVINYKNHDETPCLGGYSYQKPWPALFAGFGHGDASNNQLAFRGYRY
jgi:hypothetical protein